MRHRGEPERAATMDCIRAFDWKYVAQTHANVGRSKWEAIQRRVTEPQDAIRRTLTSPDTVTKALKMMLKDKGIQGQDWAKLWEAYDTDDKKALDRPTVLQIILDQLKTCAGVMRARRDGINLDEIRPMVEQHLDDQLSGQLFLDLARTKRDAWDVRIRDLDQMITKMRDTSSPEYKMHTDSLFARLASPAPGDDASPPDGAGAAVKSAATKSRRRGRKAGSRPEPEPEPEPEAPSESPGAREALEMAGARGTAQVAAAQERRRLKRPESKHGRAEPDPQVEPVDGGDATIKKVDFLRNIVLYLTDDDNMFSGVLDTASLEVRRAVAAKEQTWRKRRRALETGMATGTTLPLPGGALETVVSAGSQGQEHEQQQQQQEEEEEEQEEEVVEEEEEEDAGKAGKAGAEEAEEQDDDGGGGVDLPEGTPP
jgi:hypothetical protein